MNHTAKHMWIPNLSFMLIGITLLLVMVLVVRADGGVSSSGEETSEHVISSPTLERAKTKKAVSKVHNTKITKVNTQKAYFSTINSEGRFGNHFFRNMYWHALAEKNDLNIEYSYQDMFQRLLGWKFYKGKRGRVSVSPSTIIKDADMMRYMDELLQTDEQVETDMYFFGQTREFCLWLRKYFTDNNLYPTTTVEPNTVFVHVRLGDVAKFNPGLTYYRKVLQKLQYTSGFVASDTPGHEICQTLLAEFPKLKMVSDKLDEVDTLLLALSQQHLIISHGTFSWLAAFLSFTNTRVHYPDMPQGWHGDIFVFDDWIKEPVV